MTQRVSLHQWDQSGAEDGDIARYDAATDKWVPLPLSVEAGEIVYDNTTSGLTAEDVQAALDEIVAEMPVDTDDQDASEVEYDNTTSGLAADTVQEAIDEIVATEPPASAALVLLTTTVGGEPELIWTADNQLVYTVEV